MMDREKLLEIAEYVGDYEHKECGADSYMNLTRIYERIVDASVDILPIEFNHSLIYNKEHMHYIEFLNNLKEDLECIDPILLRFAINWVEIELEKFL